MPTTFAVRTSTVWRSTRSRHLDTGGKRRGRARLGRAPGERGARQAARRQEGVGGGRGQRARDQVDRRARGLERGQTVARDEQRDAPRRRAAMSLSRRDGGGPDRTAGRHRGPGRPAPSRPVPHSRRVPTPRRRTPRTRARPAPFRGATRRAAPSPARPRSGPGSPRAARASCRPPGAPSSRSTKLWRKLAPSPPRMETGGGELVGDDSGPPAPPRRCRTRAPPSRAR